MGTEIRVQDEAGGELLLYAVESAKVNGAEYLLAADTEEGDGEAYVLKDISGPEESEAQYVFVDDETELNAVLGVFQELMAGEGVDTC